MSTAAPRVRRVIVTGAAGALGSATVAALRARGTTVAGLDVAAADGVIACDVCDTDSVAAAVAQARARMGGIDAVVHFAGIGLPSSAGQGPGAPDLRTLDINLLGPWRVTAACIEDVAANRGRLVFVASELAYATIPFAAAYIVSKRGLAAYADAVRAEYGTHVGVTTVYPGYVRTPIHEAGAAAGLALEGTVRAQRPESVTATVLRALSAGRPPRDLACSPMGRFELAAARHLPSVVDAVIGSRTRRAVGRGRYSTAPLAAGLSGRLGHPDAVPLAPIVVEQPAPIALEETAV
jgi:NAD(P)-dependent dehydrogenase (short-subunit alcohol dehydrogenase family)